MQLIFVKKKVGIISVKEIGRLWFSCFFSLFFPFQPGAIFLPICCSFSRAISSLLGRKQQISVAKIVTFQGVSTSLIFVCFPMGFNDAWMVFIDF